VGGLEGEGRGPLGDGPTNATTGEQTREDEQ
jgi:hypothetical protein